MAIEHEVKADIFQAGAIKPIVPPSGSPADISVETTFLKYDTSRAPTNPEHLITKRYVDSILNSSGAVISFSAGASNPIVISNWHTLYAPQFGNGRFIVQYKIASSPDQIQDKYDAIITRTKDAGTNTYQDSVSFDLGIVAHDGQIVIEFSNAPLP